MASRPFHLVLSCKEQLALRCSKQPLSHVRLPSVFLAAKLSLISGKHSLLLSSSLSSSNEPDSPHQIPSSTTATVPSLSIANRHVKHRLHRCAIRKSDSSKLFGRSGPTYTPYHMMVESRPLYLLIRLIRSPIRLQRRYHADPLLTGTSNVVYICMPFANYTVASSSADQDQPTHHTI